jgi:glyoxylase-like metal-dependent hydrolase (beta-lactamase superfamily II)
MRMYVLSGPKVEIPWTSLTIVRHLGEMLKVPVNMYLIQGDDANVLVDTGVRSEAVDNPSGIGEAAKAAKVYMRREDYVVDQLSMLGLRPADVDYVVLTHMHWDHAGGLREFRESEVLVQYDEYRYALYPDSFYRWGYIKEDFEGVRVKTISGIHYLLEGKVIVFPTPGHTPGHQSVMVRLNSGNYVITGDALNLMENLDEGVFPWIQWNLPSMLKSVELFKALQRFEKATLLPSHDPFVELKRPPHFYS